MAVFTFRAALPTDVDMIVDCIRRSSVLTQNERVTSAITHNEDDISNAREIAARIHSGELSYVACADTEVAGYIAFKRGNHLSMLFVRPELQRQGLGRRLLAFGFERFDVITVNSSESAVEFYRRLGFQVVGEPFVKSGAALTPMLWNTPARLRA